MGKIKKAGVCVGIAMGGLIGGTISMIGKMADKKIIDELGESIMDSTILTGEIVGEMASGATHVVAGAVKKEPKKVKRGKKELGTAGGRMVENVITNVKNVAEQSGEILEGVKEQDKQRVAKGLRTLAKMIAVGILTVGAIKVNEIADHEVTTQPEKKRPDEEELKAGRPDEGELKEGRLDEKKPEYPGAADPVAEAEAEKADVAEAEMENADVAEAEAENADVEQADFLRDGDDVKGAEAETDGDGCFERKPSLEEELEKKIRF